MHGLPVFVSALSLLFILSLLSFLSPSLLCVFIAPSSLVRCLCVSFALLSSLLSCSEWPQACAMSSVCRLFLSLLSLHISSRVLYPTSFLFAFFFVYLYARQPIYTNSAAFLTQLLPKVGPETSFPLVLPLPQALDLCLPPQENS